MFIIIILNNHVYHYVTQLKHCNIKYVWHSLMKFLPLGKDFFFFWTVCSCWNGSLCRVRMLSLSRFSCVWDTGEVTPFQ
jgi:hypothetical protein